MLKSRSFSFQAKDFINLYQDLDWQREALSFSLPKKSQTWLKEFWVSQIKAQDPFPYFFSCWAQSLDGKLTLSGQKTGNAVSRSLLENPIGGELDFWWLNLARATAEAVIVGAQTIRREPYLTSHLWDLDLRAQYPVKGGIPLHIVPTKTGDLGNQPTILKEPSLPLLVYTTRKGFENLENKFQRPFSVIKKEEMTLKSLGQEALILLKEDFKEDLSFFSWLKTIGLNRILVESPSFTYDLLKEKLLKEMWITSCGIFSGEEQKVSLGFSGGNLPHAKLISLYLSGGNYLYARYNIKFL